MRIYCTAYPKSGVTWLVRLLSDLLDSPQVGPETGSLVWGVSSDGSHEIVKTHWRVDQYSEGDHKIVLCQRDPRDVAISAMFYRSLEPTSENLMAVLRTMLDLNSNDPNPIYHIRGIYEGWLQTWLDSHRYDVLTRYELLFDLTELQRIVYELTNMVLAEDRIKESMERQSFENVAPRFPHSMRKGIVGDWRNHFGREHGEYITEHLGEFMIEQRYIEDLKWWQKL